MLNILHSKFRPKKDRRLGRAEHKRRYDLPLTQDEGSYFLILLITLMTFLALIALSTSFALGAITSDWSKGLKNKITIEIPAKDPNGDLRNKEALIELQEKTVNTLNGMDIIHSSQVIVATEIQDMVSPWLGNNFSFDDIILPSLISVSLSQSTPENIELLEKTLASIDATMQLDTHEKWLENISHLSNALRFGTFAITLVITLTLFMAVTSAVRSRIAIYKSDIELLHLMGASDPYISSQFQRHTLILAFKGTLTGLAFAALAFWAISLISGDQAETLLPNFTPTTLHYAGLLSLPILTCIISSYTARFTVLRALALLP